VAQNPPLPFLLGKTALKLLSSIIPDASSLNTLNGQTVTLTQHLLTLLRRLLPLLTTKDASIFLPQPTVAGLNTPRSNPVMSSQAPPDASNASPTLVAGPLTSILLLPLQSGGRLGWPRTSSIPLQSAELLVAACGGEDPLDEVLDRLLPLWLPLFRCAPQLQSGFGGSRGGDSLSDAHRSSSSSRASNAGQTLTERSCAHQNAGGRGINGQRRYHPGCSPAPHCGPHLPASNGEESRLMPRAACLSDTGFKIKPAGSNIESGYWDVVRVLYDHATTTLGSSAVRQVVEGWKTLEKDLFKHTGWKPDKGVAAGDSALSLRQSLQVSLLKSGPASVTATSPTVASTALLIDGIGWSVSRGVNALPLATTWEHPRPRWLPQTPMAGPSVRPAPQTPLYQPNPADVLRGFRPADPPLTPSWSGNPSPLAMFSWPAHKARISCACVSACETMLLTAARRDGSMHAAVRSWHLEDFSPGAQYMRHTDVVSSAIFASEVRGIAASTDISGALHFWRICDAEPIAVISAGMTPM
jgi:hypothetical protein